MTAASAMPAAVPERLGRYLVFDEIARGGMATVHVGRVVSLPGFSRLVAIKRLLPWLADDPVRIRELMREARLAARIVHPNVVQTFDVIEECSPPAVVMELVRGVSLSKLLEAARSRGERLPPPVVLTIALDALTGLHAAHEACDETGRPLGLVHRDVSPQNILVDARGVARVLDFGIAKALGTEERTSTGEVKGKLAYMAREQLLGQPVTRQTDVHAMGIVLWEALTGRRLFGSSGDEPGRVVTRILTEPRESPRDVVPDLDPELERIVMRALAPQARDRFASAGEMGAALAPLASAPATEVGSWVNELAGDAVTELEDRLRRAELHEPADTGTLGGGSGTAVSVAPPGSGATRTRIAGWAAAGIGLGMVLVLIVRGWDRTPVAAATPAPALATATATATATTTETATPTTTTTETAIHPAATTTSTGLPAAVRASPSRPRPTWRPRGLDRSHAPSTPATAASPPPPTPAANDDCALPYTLDDKGQKHYKEACLR